MHATRPRSSILHLFDPLASTAPFPDVPSPESDKENSCPALTEALTVGHTLKQPSPVVLKRRLVDVGDVTVDDPSMLAMLTDEEELDESMCDDDNDTLTLLQLPTTTPARAMVSQVERRTQTSSTPRTPLGELALDRDITPIARTKMYKRQPPVPSSSDSVIPTASDDSNISSVVDAVNASVPSFSSPGLTKPSLNYHDLVHEQRVPKRNPHDTEIPQITVSSADVLSESLSTLNLATPTGLTNISHPFASTPLSHASAASPLHLSAGLRPNPLHRSAEDPNRRSVDLYSSFQLQLQSEEASFDLLNDKISFFASINGVDSFLHVMEEDDSFDISVEEKTLQQAVEKMQLEETPEKGTKVSVEDIIPHINKAESNENIGPPPTIATTSVEKTKSKNSPGRPFHEDLNSNPPASPTIFLGRGKQPAALRELTSGSSASTPVFIPTSPNQHVTTQTGVHTPPAVVREAVPPPPVPALRIVKRAKRAGHEKTNSSSSASSSEAASARRETIETSPSRTSSSIEAAPVPPPTRQKSTFALGAGRVASRAAGPAPAAAVPSCSTGTGPRRVPNIDSQASTAGTRAGFGNQRVLPTANMTGPRRVVVAPVVHAAATIAPSRVFGVSGVRAPARYGTGTKTTSSTLPRPVSRLPAPSGSGISRPRPVAGTATGIDAGSQRNAEKAGLSRRMACGGQ